MWLQIKYKRIHREIKEDRKSVSEKSALELELDINEFQELQAMWTWPFVRNSLALRLAQLETVLNKVGSTAESGSNAYALRHVYRCCRFRFTFYM